MKYEFAPVESLRPIESRVYRAQVDYYRHQLARGVDVGPSCVVPLHDGVLDQDLVLVDTHHRTYARYMLGGLGLVVPVEIYDTDQDIEDGQIGCLNRVNSLWDLRTAYERIWQPRLEHFGVSEIADLELY
ncbi:MAG TPA: hypothetical protein VJP80_04540 [Candidatus Saccharimonadales bacterium]|nr:hypothetical protein [Candidatus Saccharimonadales bacterium]